MLNQHLRIPFTAHGAKGSVDVQLWRNKDPVSVGLDLVIPGEDLTPCIGFPIFQATPSISLVGYGTICGWIQVVKSTDRADIINDVPPMLYGVETPFCFFGPNCQMFDAPGWTESRPVDWIATTFLFYLDDVEMSKHVKPPVVAVQWGLNTEESPVRIKPLEQVPLPAWNEAVPFLRKHYPAWTFDTVGTSSAS